MAKSKEEKQSKTKVKAYILGDGELLSADTLERYRLKREDESSEVKSRALSKTASRELGRKGIVMPPVNYASLVNLLDANTWHSKCVRVKAQDTIGHGWFLESDTDDEGNATGSEENYNKLWKFFEEAAIEDGDTLLNTIDELLIDYDSIGVMSMELIRADRNEGDPVGLAHIPGDTVYRHKDKKRLVQKVGTKEVWFKRAGVKEVMDKETGEFDKSIDFTKSATEIIYWKNYTPRSELYGLPQIWPALGAILGDMNQRDYNISFFENHAVPQFAVIVEGGDLDPEVEATIKDYFEHKIKDNPHSTLIMTVPPKEAHQKEGVKIRFEKLAVDIKEAHFRLYRMDVRNEILAAHAVPLYRLGIAEKGDLNSSTARYSNEIYKFQEIDPRRQMIEDKINLFVVREGFGITDWRFRLQELDISDIREDSEMYGKMIDKAIRTPNQVQEALGYEKSEDPAMDMYYLNGAPVSKLGMETEERAREIAGRQNADEGKEEEDS